MSRLSRLSRLSLLLTLLLLLFAVGCRTPADDAPPAAANTPTAEPSPAPTTSPENISTPTAEPTAVPTATAVPPTPAPEPISDEEATQLMVTLLEGGSSVAVPALERVTAQQDERFIPVLLELYRARQLNLRYNLQAEQILTALTEISGQDFGENLWAWIEWYGTTDISPPDQFTSWKGRIMAELDPAFAVFLQDRHPSRLRVEEIMWGGVIVDGIPALDNPPMINPEAADYLNPWDPVFGLAINGETRAYPLRIVDWHEMVNDVVGGVPVSLAYCTLCGAAIAYDGRNLDADGAPITYDFGSSGFLYRSNKLMYDRQTQTLWNQLTGEPVLGPLAAADIRLELLPVVLTTWDEWQSAHPDTVVLAEETGFNRPYFAGAAYGHYFADDETMFPVWQRSAELAAKSQVFALNFNDTPKAYPLDLLTTAGVVNDELAGTELVLVADGGLISVDDGFSQYIGAVTYQAGAAVRAYERDGHTFQPGADAGTVVDETGAVWTVSETALTSPDGTELPRLSGHLAYWFGWYAFYPETLLYTSAD
jgi:hypothetical protein